MTRKTRETMTSKTRAGFAENMSVKPLATGTGEMAGGKARIDVEAGQAWHLEMPSPSPIPRCGLPVRHGVAPAIQFSDAAD